MKVRFGLRIKFTFIFLIFAAVISTAVRQAAYSSLEELVLIKYSESAIAAANLAASQIDGDKLVEYAQTLKTDAAYDETLKRLNNIKWHTKVTYLYVIKPVTEDSTVYIFEAWGEEGRADNINVLGSKGAYDDNFKKAKEAMATGQTSTVAEITKTREGYLASVYAPVKNSSGQTVAVVGVDCDMNEIYQFIEANMKKLVLLVNGLTMTCLVILLLIIQQGIIGPIRLLKNKVELLADGNLGVLVRVKGRNEISQISEIFNRMSQNIEGHIKEVTQLNEGYYKFVPSKIFELLRKKSVTEIRLGNQREVPLEVMSMQINDFDQLTRPMDSQELFSFMNRIYEEIVPIVLNNNGVIENYCDGGFTAIYTDSGKSSLDSAISICQALNRHSNKEKSPLKRAEAGFGISYGNIMVGIVGNDRRLSAIVISEQISIMNYLKTIAWKYKSRILITGTYVNRIPEFERRYHARYIGLLHSSTTDRLEKLYDVYDGDLDEDRSLKEMTKEKFEKGIELFLGRDFYGARLCFIEVLKLYRTDYASRKYLKLCGRLGDKKESSAIDLFIEDF